MWKAEWKVVVDISSKLCHVLYRPKEITLTNIDIADIDAQTGPIIRCSVYKLDPILFLFQY